MRLPHGEMIEVLPLEDGEYRYGKRVTQRFQVLAEKKGFYVAVALELLA